MVETTTSENDQISPYVAKSVAESLLREPFYIMVANTPKKPVALPKLWEWQRLEKLLQKPSLYKRKTVALSSALLITKDKLDKKQQFG